MYIFKEYMYIFDMFSGRYVKKHDEFGSFIRSVVSKEAVVYLWPTVKLIDPNPDKTIGEIWEILGLPELEVIAEYGIPRKIEIYADRLMIDDEKRNILVIDTKF